MTFIVHGKGYNHKPSWKESRKERLYKKTCEEFPQLQSCGYSCGVPSFDGKPYISMDRFGSGVFINRITHLSRKEQVDYHKRFYKVYQKVMNDNM